MALPSPQTPATSGIQSKNFFTKQIVTKLLTISYPSSYTPSSTGSCTFTINKCASDICQLRIDFQTMSGFDETAGVCSDKLATAGMLHNMKDMQLSYIILRSDRKTASNRVRHHDWLPHVHRVRYNLHRHHHTHPHLRQYHHC